MWFAIVGKRTLHGTSARTRLPGGEAGAAEDEHLVVADAVRLHELGAGGRVAVELDHALVGDLAAARRVERRLAQLREERAVAEILVGVELREHVGLVVADERRRVGRARRSRRRAACRTRRRRARSSRCSAIRRAVVVDVDRLAALLGELDRELEREAVGGGERERVLARDRVLAGELLEDLEPALERLAEALLLRLHDPLDLVRLLDELGERAGDLLDHDPRAAGRRPSARCGCPAGRRGG